MHRAAGGDEGAGERLWRRLLGTGEQTVRPEHKDHDQQQECEQIAVAGAEDRHAVAFHQPQQETANHGARHIARAADHLRDNTLQRRVKAHRSIDLVVVHADQHAGKATKRGGNPEHCLVHAVDIDAHLHGGVAVLCRGPHSPAKLGIAQEDKQQQRTGDADTGD